MRGVELSGRERSVLEAFSRMLGDREWRLNHLYWIEDKNGRRVRFRMNWAQERLNRELWHRNAILKARQLGISTYSSMLLLDQALFVEGFHGGVVDKSLPDAGKKLAKMKFAWNMLEYVPPGAGEEDRALAVLGRLIKERSGEVVKGRLRMPVSSATAIGFRNGSDVEVGVSMRGGTVHLLHLSEYGSVAANHPKKAAEILTGAFNAVPKSGIIINESTHEGGKVGQNYEIMKGAIDLMGCKLSPLQWRFFFFPWFRDPEYSLEGSVSRFEPEDEEYFARLEEKEGIELTMGQKRWYVDMRMTQREKMRQENPSTWEEALWPHVTGAIYNDLMSRLRDRGRVGVDFEYEPGFPVYSCWDIGVNDAMAVWAVQFVGMEVRVLDFWQESGREIGWYVDVIRRWEQGWMGGGRMRRHFLPHDGTRNGLTMEDASGLLRKAGLADVVVVPRISRVWTGISYVRTLMKSMVFHARTLRPIKGRGEGGLDLMCGVDCLCAYHKASVVVDGRARDEPVHDAASHGADALRTIGEAWARRMIPEAGVFVEVEERRTARRNGWSYQGGFGDDGGEVLM